MSARHEESFLARRSRLGLPNYLLVALLMAFALAMLPMAAIRVVQTQNNDLRDWLPASYPESKELKWFQRHFVGEQFILASWEGCTLGNDEKLRLMVEKLKLRGADSPASARSATAEERKLFHDIITGPMALARLMSPPLNLEYGEAIERLEGSLVGPLPEATSPDDPPTDAERTTCLVVTLSKLGQSNNKQKERAVAAIHRIATEECGIAEDELHLGGPPVDNVAIDQEGRRTLRRLAGLCGIVGLTLSYLCFRSIRLTAMVFSVGVLSAALGLSFVYYYGVIEVLYLGYSQPRLGTVDAILMSMPSVVYVLGLSGAIHIVNYYRDARREHGIAGAVEIAVRHGWRPCALAAVTTAVGLGSLYISDITPIRKFGVFSAVGVLGTLALLFTLLPVALHRFPTSPAKERKRQKTSHPIYETFMNRIAQFIVGRNALVSAAMVLLMICVGYGLTKIETRVQLLKLFDEDARIIHDYAWLEQHLGNLVPMEVVLTLKPDRLRAGEEDAEANGRLYQLNLYERMRLVRRVQQRIESLGPVGRAMSAVTFGPDLDRNRSSVIGSDPAFVINSQLEKNRAEMIDDGDYLRDEFAAGKGKPAPDGGVGGEDGRRELWRISVRLTALGEVDYGVFVQSIRGVVEPVLRGYQRRDLVLQALHEKDQGLRRSRIAVLYSDADEPETAEAMADYVPSPGRFLAELLHEGKAQVQPINLAKAQEQLRDEANAEKVRAFLSSVDGVVLAGTGKFDTAQLTEGAGLVLDVMDMPLEVAAAADAAAVGAERNIGAVYTGLVPLVYKTQRQLLTSLVESSAVSFGLIAVVMMLVLRSAPAGLLSMLPNMFPIVVVFGAMGWLGVKIDIGIMMTASVALGVAVDDTVHFLTWFRDGIRQGLDRKAATLLAYERCATAMFQTTVIGGLGLAVFMASTFTPTQQFGTLMITHLTAALIGDLIFLPAILSGWGGRFFEGARGKAGAADTSAEHGGEQQTGKVAAGEHALEPHLADRPARYDSAHTSRAKNRGER